MLLVGRLTSFLTVACLAVSSRALLSPPRIPTPIPSSHVVRFRTTRWRPSASRDSSRMVLWAMSLQDGWNTERIIAARVALISSESFQELLEKVGVTEFQDDTKIAGDKAGDGWENATHHHRENRKVIATVTHDTETDTGSPPRNDDERQRRSTWAPSQLWEANGRKLDSLRSTVMTSEKAREIRGYLRRENRDTGEGTSPRPRSRTPTSLFMRSTAAVDSSATQGGAWAGAGETTGKRTWTKCQSVRRPNTRGSKRPAGANGGVVGDYAGSFEPGARDGRRQGSIGIRWIRNLTSRLSNAGKRVRGHAARVVGRRQEQ